LSGGLFRQSLRCFQFVLRKFTRMLNSVRHIRGSSVIDLTVNRGRQKTSATDIANASTSSDNPARFKSSSAMSADSEPS
jgi:hypothetical protein